MECSYMRTMMKSKIHRARVTEANLNYEGSITIDKKLMAAVDIVPYEQVHVLNINNGARFTTYALEGPEGSGDICLNGAAARLGIKGDLVIIIAYTQMSEAELLHYRPKVVLVDEHNAITPGGAETMFA